MMSSSDRTLPGHLLMTGLALLATACAGPSIVQTDYGFRSGLLNPDHGQFHASAEPERDPEPVRPRPIRAQTPPRVATRVQTSAPVPARKTQAARFPEPASVHRPQQVVAAPLPHATPEPARTAYSPSPVPAGQDAAHALRATQRVDAAAALLGTPGLADRAFVAHVLRASGQDVDVERNQAYPKALFEKLTATAQAVDHKQARPGDLVFFRDTADLNGNGKPDDGVTMVGVVERVEGSRVVFIAQRANKVRRMAVDPTQPLVVRDARDEVVNTRLVRWPGSQVPLTTGQCLSGYLRP